MPTTESTVQDRMCTLKGITNTLDKVESVEIPQGSKEDNISFLLELFKVTDDQSSNHW